MNPSTRAKSKIWIYEMKIGCVAYLGEVVKKALECIIDIFSLLTKIRKVQHILLQHTGLSHKSMSQMELLLMDPMAI